MVKAKNIKIEIGGKIIMKTKSNRTVKGRPYVSTLLAIALVFALLTAMPLTASADEDEAPAATGSMSNFVRTRLYTPGIFTDVNENMWYGYEKEKAVMLAYEYELMSGNSATTFNPTGNLTIAEAITVTTRIHSFYATGHQVEFTPIPDAPWFQGNVNYAIENGIIGASIFSDYRRTATRAEMAYIFAHALPDTEYQERYDVNSPPDVNASTPYYNEITMLYRAGIVGGDGGTWAFRPADNITRVEAAAIISRLVVVNTRLGYDYYYPGFTS